MTVDPEGRARSLRRTDKVSEAVARDIVQRISDQSLRPGDKLPAEAAMIAGYGVGRGTLREALRLLESNGMITIRPGPGGGPQVRAVTAEDFGRSAALFFTARSLSLDDLIEARSIMEPLAARLAAVRREPGPDLDHLRRSVELDTAAEDPAYAEATRDFHTAVIRLCGNGVISLFTESLATLFHDRVRGVHFPRGRHRQTVREAHATVAQAIIDGAADQAEEAMREHMRTFVAFVKKSHPQLKDEIITWPR